MKKDIEVQMFRKRIMNIIISTIIILGLLSFFINIEKKALSNGTNVTVNLNTNELWTSTVEGMKVYCVQEGADFKGGNVTARAVVERNLDGTDKAAIAYAYVLDKNKPDKVKTRNQMINITNNAQKYFYNHNAEYAPSSKKITSKEEAEKIFMNGIYKITSDKQNAIWAITHNCDDISNATNIENNFKEGTSWEDANNLVWMRSSRMVRFIRDGENYSYVLYNPGKDYRSNYIVKTGETATDYYENAPELSGFSDEDYYQARIELIFCCY